MPSVSISDGFIERLKTLTKGRREHIISRLEWFQQRPGNPQLRLRPLRSAAGHFLIDSVRYDRIILRLESDGVYVAVDCGGHEILDEWDRRARESAPSASSSGKSPRGT